MRKRGTVLRVPRASHGLPWSRCGYYDLTHGEAALYLRAIAQGYFVCRNSAEPTAENAYRIWCETNSRAFTVCRYRRTRAFLYVDLCPLQLRLTAHGVDRIKAYQAENSLDLVYERTYICVDGVRRVEAIAHLQALVALALQNAEPRWLPL